MGMQTNNCATCDSTPVIYNLTVCKADGGVEVMRLCSECGHARGLDVPAANPSDAVFEAGRRREQVTLARAEWQALVEGLQDEATWRAADVAEVRHRVYFMLARFAGLQDMESLENVPPAIPRLLAARSG
jgi:hypothetical protein